MALPTGKAVRQGLGLRVDELHPVCPVKHPVGEAVFRRLSGDRLDKIRKAFYLTHIGGSVDVNPRLEQFLHILVPAAVPLPWLGWARSSSASS